MDTTKRKLMSFTVLGAHENRNFFEVKVDAPDGLHAFGAAALLLQEAGEEGDAEFYAAVSSDGAYELPGEGVVTLETVLDPEQSEVFGLAILGKEAGIDQGSLADAAFQNYEFGDGVAVTDSSGWEYTTPGHERTRKVYVESYPEFGTPAERWALQFTVRFDPETGQVADAYALDEKGQRWNAPQPPLIEPKALFNAAQEVLLKSYSTGDFEHILNFSSWNEVEVELSQCGDSLLRFLLVELSNSEDCTTVELGVERITSVIEDLEALSRNLLDSLSNEATVSDPFQ